MSHGPLLLASARQAPVRSGARRWLWAGLLVGAVVLPTLVTLEILLMRHVGPRPRSSEAPAEADTAVQQSQGPPVRLSPWLTDSASAVTGPVPENAKPPRAPEKKSPAKAESPPPEPDVGAGPVPVEFREALGGLTGSHLSQAHLSIGLVADAVEKDLYSAAQGRQLLGVTGGLIDAVGKKLQRLPRNTLTAGEQVYLERARAVEKLLRTQVEQLRRYWDSGHKEDADRFQKTRKQSWTALRELLGSKS